MKKTKIVEMTQNADAEIAVDDALQDMNEDLAKDFMPAEYGDVKPYPELIGGKLAANIDVASNDIQERLVALDHKRSEAMDRLKTTMAEVIAIDKERAALAQIKLQNTMWRLAGADADIPPGEGAV